MGYGFMDNKKSQNCHIFVEFVTNLHLKSNLQKNPVEMLGFD